MDRTGSESCPVDGFCITGVETLCSASGECVNCSMDLTKIGCGVGKWIELA